MKNAFYWLSRVLAILFIAFISMFALDVFGEPQWFLTLLIHLIPSFILVILTIIAWKYEQLGGLMFIAAGVFMLIFFHPKSLIVSIPTVVIGTLFLGNKYFSKT